MSTDGYGTKWHRNIVENFNRLIRVHKRYRRQTDGRAFAKNHVLIIIIVINNNRSKNQRRSCNRLVISFGTDINIISNEQRQSCVPRRQGVWPFAVVNSKHCDRAIALLKIFSFRSS